MVKKFNDVVVIDNISFEVNKGEVVGLLGENGAGKTTTLRMISNILNVTSGEIKINEISMDREANKFRNEIGILFGGDVGLYDRLTAKENIEYFASLFGMKQNEINKRIEQLSKEFNMQEYINKRVGKFSRGMKQKVSIVRSIIHNPSVILFDEPCTGLDVNATRVVHEFIRKCKAENKIILLSSHSMSEVEKLCDKVIIIHKGKVIEKSTISELKKKYKNSDLEEVFLHLIGGGINE